MRKDANLGDVTNVATSRTNLGLGDSATRNVGTTAGTVAAGNDARFLSQASEKCFNLPVETQMVCILIADTLLPQKKVLQMVLQHLVLMGKFP